MKQQTLRQKIDSIIKDIQKNIYVKKTPYTETTPIKLGFSQSDFTKISYITEKRQNQLIENNVIKSKQFTKEERKKYFFHTSPHKLLSKFINIDADDLQTYANKLSQYIIDKKKIDLKAFEGSEIADIYNMSKHRFGESSCMQEKHKSYFEIYEHLPVKLYALIENGELLARCLVWTKSKDSFGKEDKQIYIDRIYSFGNDAISKIIYKKIILKIREMENLTKGQIINAYNVRHLPHIMGGKTFLPKNIQFKSYPPFSFVSIKNDMQIDDFNALPYMDTFMYSCGDFLQVDEDSDTRYKLNCTGGTYEEIEPLLCECCGAAIDEEEQIYCEDVQETRCEDCSRYSSADDRYYAEENVTYISGNIESYIHNDDIEN